MSGKSPWHYEYENTWYVSSQIPSYVPLGYTLIEDKFPKYARQVNLWQANISGDWPAEVKRSLRDEEFSKWGADDNKRIIRVFSVQHHEDVMLEAMCSAHSSPSGFYQVTWASGLSKVSGAEGLGYLKLLIAQLTSYGPHCSWVYASAVPMLVQRLTWLATAAEQADLDLLWWHVA